MASLNSLTLNGTKYDCFVDTEARDAADTALEGISALDEKLNGVPSSIDLSALDTEGKIVETFADGTTKTTTMDFDENGNPIKITDGDGNETVLTW